MEMEEEATTNIQTQSTPETAPPAESPQPSSPAPSQAEAQPQGFRGAPPMTLFGVSLRQPSLADPLDYSPAPDFFARAGSAQRNRLLQTLMGDMYKETVNQIVQTAEQAMREDQLFSDRYAALEVWCRRRAAAAAAGDRLGASKITVENIVKLERQLEKEFSDRVSAEVAVWARKERERQARDKE